MHHPQVLIYESDGRLAALLRPVAEAHKPAWSLREPRQLGPCLRLLARARPGVLVLKVGRNLERELALLERVAWLYPDVGCVVVGDSEHANLAGLAWDLGASYVLLPPQPRDRLVAIVTGLMAAEIPESRVDREVADA
jgi:DNA-binding NarL/FixJ family response regulator